jgi:LacI family transcriptional regulator
VASVTITDVAKAAGVSMKTVSRVLNAEPHVSDELRERVLAAAKELRYRPKVSARSLAGARSYVVAFLLTSEYLQQAAVPYILQAQLGALAACRTAGYHLLIETLDLSGDLEQEIEALSGALAVDGLILLPPLCDNRPVLDQLDRAEIGYVRIAPATDAQRSAYVEADDREAAAEMTRHLLGLGHRRIGFITGPDGHSASVRRLEGFRAAMAEAGAQVDESLIRPGRFTFDSGYEAAGELLSAAEPPTAVFASNDLMAFGTMARAQELGHRIPDTLSVAGFDDTPTASMVWPGLTTMRQPIAQMTGIATELIIARAAKAGADDSRRAPLTCELVVRGSTAPPGRQ